MSPSETRRGFARIASNYTRLLLTLAIGIVMVRYLIAGLGPEAFGLWGLLISTAGIAGLFREVVMYALNRELGEAYHHKDPEKFTHTFSAAYRICTVLSLAAALLFVILIFILPVFEIPEALIRPAAITLTARGIYTCIIIALTPTINMLVVSERMTLFNMWMTAERAVPLLTAIILFPVLGFTDPAQGLIQFGIWSSAGMILVAILAAAVAISIDRRLIPTFRRTTPEAIRSIAATGGWNTLVVIALNMHIRFDQIIMNIAFGLPGNAVFTIATQFTSYARMATVGMTDGLDVVAARVTSNPADTQSIKTIARHSTRLHAFVALPAAVTVMIIAEPLLSLWVGSRLENPDSVIPLTVTTVRILAIGIAARSISDGWVRLLYGAGHVSKYAPLLALGGLANPIFAIAIIFAARSGILPSDIGFYGPAIAFSAIFTVVHLFLLARIAARLHEETTREFLTPILRPALATLLALPALLIPAFAFDFDDLLTVTVSISAFGLLFTPLAWLVILDSAERSRFSAAIKRIARRK